MQATLSSYQQSFRSPLSHPLQHHSGYVMDHQDRLAREVDNFCQGKNLKSQRIITLILYSKNGIVDDLRALDGVIQPG